MVEYSIKNEKEFHGHTLIWHEQQPDWIKKYDGSREEWEKISIFTISTYDTDYFLVRQKDLDATIRSLRDKGHKVSSVNI